MRESPGTESAALTTPDKAELYRSALEMLNRNGVPYLVGGSYAFQYYAGIARFTKDFDMFVRPRDLPPTSDRPAAAPPCGPFAGEATRGPSDPD